MSNPPGHQRGWTEISAEVRRLIDDIGELSTTTSISVASYYARYDPAGMLARELVDLVTAAVAAQ